MKTLISIIGLLFLFSINTSGQILEKEANMSLGVQTGSELVLLDIKPNDAVKLWKTFFKDYGKTKRNKKADEYYSTGVRINKIFSVSNIDVYTHFDERGSNTQMTLWVDLGMAFINSKDYPTEYQGVIEFMDEFRIYTRQHVIQEELDAAEKDLDKIKSNLSKLEKNNIKLHDKISDYEQKIIDAENDISNNLITQEEKKMEIDKQIEILKQIQLRMESIRNQ